jgi:hypothetical protein
MRRLNVVWVVIPTTSSPRVWERQGAKGGSDFCDAPNESEGLEAISEGAANACFWTPSVTSLIERHAMQLPHAYSGTWARKRADARLGKARRRTFSVNNALRYFMLD